MAGALAGYVAQVAHWLGSPSWAQVSAPSLGAPAALGAYVVLAAVSWAGLSYLLRRRGMRPRARVVLILMAAAAIVAGLAARPAPAAPELGRGLVVKVLDVGQGDAILLDPVPGLPILVDGGPPGDELAAKLGAAGVLRLAAAVVTHYQSDHVGGIEEILGRVPVAHVLYGEPVRRISAEARGAGADPVQVAEGSELDSGRLRLQFLWPPRSLESRHAVRPRTQTPGRSSPSRAGQDSRCSSPRTPKPRTFR